MPKKKAEPGSLTWNIGANVRRLRKPTGRSHEELAHVCGYHRTNVGMIERGEKNVSLVNIHRIADALKVETAELFREG